MEGAGDRVDVVESGSMHGAGPRFEATGSAETGCGANGSGARHASARLCRCLLAVCGGRRQLEDVWNDEGEAGAMAADIARPLARPIRLASARAIDADAPGPRRGHVAAR